jgi:hypothetical protein
MKQNKTKQLITKIRNISKNEKKKSANMKKPEPWGRVR